MTVKNFGKTLADTVDRVSDWISDAVTAALLWGALVWVPWKDVRSGRSSSDVDAVAKGKYEGGQAEFLFELGRQAAEHTDDKAKHLLGLSSALAALVVVFAPEVSPIWLSLAPALPLFMSVLLCIRQLGVRTEMVPFPDPNLQGQDDEGWGYDVLTAYKYNETARRFLVNLYAASRRWLTVAIIMLSVTALRRSPSPDPTATELASLRQLMQTREASQAEQFQHWQVAIDSLLRRIQGDTARPPPQPGGSDATGERQQR